MKKILWLIPTIVLIGASCSAPQTPITSQTNQPTAATNQEQTTAQPAVPLNNSNVSTRTEVDSDGDGLTDQQEVTISHTDPHNTDTDGDGYSDSQEFNSGHDPLVSVKNTTASTTQLMDCGVAGPVTAPHTTTYAADVTTSKAWQCFVEHFELCTSAKINAAMDSSSPTRYLEFKIVGKQGTTCEISGPRINLQTGQMGAGSCSISTRYLDAYFTQSAKNNSSLNQTYLKGYLAANLVMFGTAKPISYSDGASETVICK